MTFDALCVRCQAAQEADSQSAKKVRKKSQLRDHDRVVFSRTLSKSLGSVINLNRLVNIPPTTAPIPPCGALRVVVFEHK